MVDLASIPAEVLLARGKYSTVNNADKDRKKSLVSCCEGIMHFTPAIAKFGQQEDAGGIQKARDGLAMVREFANKIEANLDAIESLAKQRQELKSQAWPK